jgi:autotransporter-associated beta strand protein
MFTRSSASRAPVAHNSRGNSSLRRGGLLAAAIATTIASQAWADMLSLEPSADTFVRFGVNQNVNYGTQPLLDIFQNGTARAYFAYVRFDLSTLPANAVITDATLTFTRTSGGTRGDTMNTARFGVYGLNDVAGNTPQNWTETSLVFSGGTENVGQEYVANGGTQFDIATRVTSFDGVGETVADPLASITGSNSSLLVNFLNTRYAAGGLSTFIVDAPNTDPGRGYALGSREAVDPAIRPILALTYTVGAPTPTWSASGGGSWGTGSNWVPGAPTTAADNAVFGPAIGGAAVITLDGNRAVGNLTFNSGTNSYTIAQGSGGTLTIGDGASPRTVSVVAGDHTISAPVSLAGITSANPAAFTSLTISGQVSGTGSLVKDGPGTVNLSAANTYTGNTTINAGRLAISNAAALGDASIGTAIAGGDTTANLAVSGGIASAETLIVGGKSGNSGATASIVNLSGANTLSGAITGGLGGNQYNLESIDGTITLAGGITMEGSATGDRFLNLQGAGNGVISGPVSNGGGNVILTKRGTGTWTLSGANGYTGNTNVNEGTLAIAGASNIASSPVVTLASAATLNVSGTTATYATGANQILQGTGTVVGNYNHNQGTLRPGAVQSAGTLTFANNLSIGGGAALAMDLTANPAAGNDLVQVNGTATLAGPATVNVSVLGGITPGSYAVVNSPNDIVGTVAGWTATWDARGNAPTLAKSGDNKQVLVNVTAPASGNLNWIGAASTQWDVKNTSEWHNTATATTDVYYQLDNVNFLDRYDGTNFVGVSTVNLNGSIAPASVTVNSDLVPFTFAGTGRITGSTAVNKLGTTILAVNNTNDYTGGTNVTAGTVQIGTRSALGTGPINMNGGTLNIQTFDPPNVLNANAATTSTLIGGSSGGTAALYTVTGSGNLNIQISGTSAVLDFRGDMTGYSGTVSIAPGTGGSGNLRFNGTNGSANATFDIQSGALINKRNTTTTPLQLGALTGAGNLSGAGGGGNTSATTWAIGGRNIDATYDGVISDGGGVTNVQKVGTGTQTFTGALTYTGTTAVNAGRLHVNGLHTGGAYSVNDTGTLAGTGTINAAVNVNDGGRLSAGTAGAAGQLSINGATTFSAAGILAPEILGAGNADKVVVTGAATLDGLVRPVVPAAFTPGAADSFEVLTATSITGAFTNAFGYARTEDGRGGMLIETTATSVVLKGFQRIGDIDLSGAVNNQDIAPFVSLLTGGTPTGAVGFAADVDGNGVVNNQDIAPFVALLTGGRPLADLAGDPEFAPLIALVPEPGTLGLLAAAGVLGLRRRRSA